MIIEYMKTRRVTVGVLQHSLKKSVKISKTAEMLMQGETAAKIKVTELNNSKINKVLNKLKNQSVVPRNSNEVAKTTANKTSSE
jgi:hypothetical protein